jgi:hypothetical protein
MTSSWRARLDLVRRTPPCARHVQDPGRRRLEKTSSYNMWVRVYSVLGNGKATSPGEATHGPSVGGQSFFLQICHSTDGSSRRAVYALRDESPLFLQRKDDICGLIQPLSGPFRYFMVLIDASTRWSYVDLLSSRNHAFSKPIAQIIRLKSKFP